MTVLTHQEAAEFLKVNEATLRKLRRRGDIHGTRVGAQYRYLRDHLEAYLRGPMPDSVEPLPGQKIEPFMDAQLPVMLTQLLPIDPLKRVVHHRGVYALNGRPHR